MSIKTFSFVELFNLYKSKYNDKFNRNITLGDKSFLEVNASVNAAVHKMVNQGNQTIQKQQFITTADEEGLNLQAADLGVARKQATQAELIIDITVNTLGGTISSGTTLLNSNSGITYSLIGTVSLGVNPTSATVRAIGDQDGGDGSGVAGNLGVGDVLSFTTPIAGVSSDAVVSSTVTTATEIEGLEDFRNRLLRIKALIPQGGAATDYRIWSEEVAGIVNAYPYTSELSNRTVDIYLEETIESSGSADGIPTAAKLQEVYDYIEDEDPDTGKASRRPISVFVTTLPIIRTGFNVTINNLTSPNLAQTKLDIESALTDFFLDRGPYIPGVTLLPRTDTITDASVVSAIENIVEEQNGSFTTAEFEPSATPGAIDKYILQRGEKAKLNAISYI